MCVCVLTKPNTTYHQREVFKENENRQEMNINSYPVQDLFGLGMNLCFPSRLVVLCHSFLTVLRSSLSGEKLMVGEGAMEEHTHRTGELFEQMTEL